MDNVPMVFNRVKTGSRLLAAGLMLCILSPPVQADERQYKIEAAYLYSFFNYITWPGYASPQAMHNPVICAYSGDPVLPYLDYVSHKMAAERELKVRAVTEEDETASCNILFMRHRISSHILTSLANSTLTVFKPDDPLDRGGMIELSEDEEHINIKINQVKLEENDFQISSRLLNLAQGTK